MHRARAAVARAAGAWARGRCGENLASVWAWAASRVVHIRAASAPAMKGASRWRVAACARHSATRAVDMWRPLQTRVEGVLRMLRSLLRSGSPRARSRRAQSGGRPSEDGLRDLGGRPLPPPFVGRSRSCRVFPFDPPQVDQRPTAMARRDPCGLLAIPALGRRRAGRPRIASEMCICSCGDVRLCADCTSTAQERQR